MEVMLFGSSDYASLSSFPPLQRKQKAQFLSQEELKEEKYAVCKAILPILQAEEDERFVKEWK
ncbi:unnamed protein product [Camellia sinensis]